MRVIRDLSLTTWSNTASLLLATANEDDIRIHALCSYIILKLINLEMEENNTNNNPLQTIEIDSIRKIVNEKKNILPTHKQIRPKNREDEKWLHNWKHISQFSNQTNDKFRLTDAISVFKTLSTNEKDLESSLRHFLTPKFKAKNINFFFFKRKTKAANIIIEIRFFLDLCVLGICVKRKVND